MFPFRLEEDRVALSAPDVRHWLPSVSTALELEEMTIAAFRRTTGPFLFSSGFVADVWSDVDHESVVVNALPVAHHHPETGFLQSLRIVVVRIAHRPSALVGLGVWA